jgi:hypothetical protein
MHPDNSFDATDTSTHVSTSTAAENGTKSATILAKRYKDFTIKQLAYEFGIFKGLKIRSGSWHLDWFGVGV